MSGWDQVLTEHELMPKTSDPEFWRTFLTENPDVFHRLLADLYQVTGRATDRPPTLEDLWDLVGPRFTNEPFGVAVRELLGDRSIRWLAGEIHIHNVPLTRVINGERDVVSIRDPKGSMARIEAIARALRVHPSYFAEWRRLWVMTLIDQAFEQHPHMSIGMYRKFARHENGR